MSKHVITTLQPVTQCQLHYVRRSAPRAYLFRNDDHSPSPRRRTSPLQLPHARAFATSPQCAASTVKQVKPSQQSQPSQPSISAQMERMKKKAMRSGDIPDDIGLLPETFVMPPAEKLPGWLSNHKDRWMMEKARMRARWADFRMVMSWKFFALKPMPKLDRYSLPTIAQELHREMFANFATGELSTVDKKLCSGLLDSLRARIAHRPPNTSYMWKLHRYVSPPRLMSYRPTVFPETAQLPSDERHGVVQAVVRIHSLQSLWPVRRVPVRDGKRTVMKDVIFSPDGAELPVERLMESSTNLNQKETVEYVVIQRMYKKAQPGPWMVWGTTEETSLASVEKTQKRKKEAKMDDKMDKEAAKSEAGA